MLSDEYSKDGYNVANKQAPYCLMWTLSCCMKELRPFISKWGRPVECDNTRSKEILGIEYIPVKQSLTEMVPSLVQVGILEDKLNREEKV